MQTGQRIGTSVGIAVITSATFTVLGATGSWPAALSTGFGLIGVVMLVTRRRRPRPARGRGHPTGLSHSDTWRPCCHLVARRGTTR